MVPRTARACRLEGGHYNCIPRVEVAGTVAACCTTVFLRDEFHCCVRLSEGRGGGSKAQNTQAFLYPKLA